MNLTIFCKLAPELLPKDLFLFMKYIVSYVNPHHHYIDIEFILYNLNQDEVLIQLPAWRPGRYELGNFAKNVQKWEPFDENGIALKFEKITKDCWKVETKGVSTVHIKYNYFAFEINAGSTFLDAAQLYMNPVNCCMYNPERINELCEMELHLPADYRVACGAKQKKGNALTLYFENFHELADSPFIASNSIQHTKITCKDIEFHFWFQGECKPNWKMLSSDFTKFINEQLEMMQSFPCDAYHFLFQILPAKIYHGVEHTTSTVIALGPGYNLMKGSLYEDLLGVSCHELFHAWNIKTIRPVEMYPYDYTKENYSKLGYVCEGVTTYYGDYLLFRSGVFNEQQYFQTFEERLQKHFDNFGRFNLSVADSSFDTWLDGYVPGVPNRKTSIYDEGCLLAFITDVFIRKSSGNKKSLDDVMLYLCTEFALKGKGYSENDYKRAVECFANKSFESLFFGYIYSAVDYESVLKDALNYVGLNLVFYFSTKFHERSLGIKVSEANGVCKVIAVYPDSVADKAGISINDEILVLNTIQIKGDSSGTNFAEWNNYFGDSKQLLTIATNGIVKQILIQPKVDSYYKTVRIQKQNAANENQKSNYELWSKNNFLIKTQK